MPTVTVEPAAPQTEESWVEQLQNGPVMVVSKLSRGLRRAQYAAFLGCLDQDEQARAQRYHQRRDRDTFVLARALLRRLLAEQLNCDAAAVEFSFNAWGKPYVKGIEVAFNVSHSEQAVAVALSLHGDVGVDIEYCGRRPVSPELITRCCTASEQQLIKDSDDPQNCFYALWTLKEAAAKAAGQGLSLELADLEFSWVADRIGYQRKKLPWLQGRGMQLQLVRVFYDYLCSLAVVHAGADGLQSPACFEYTTAGSLKPCQPELLGCNRVNR